MQHIYFDTTRFSPHLRILSIICIWIAGWSSVFAQTDPCSINPGSNFDVCFNADEFKLNGLIGPNVIPSSVNWSVNNPGFDIDDPNAPQTLVFPSPLTGDFPFGTYIFTLTATCLGGQQLTTTVEVTVEDLSNVATILANGQNVSALTVCTVVHLTPQTLPGPGQIGTWYYYFADNDINFIGGGDNQNFWDISIDPNTETPCQSYTFYYEISNGGCFSRDSVTITFEAQDENVRFIYPADQGRYCVGELFTIQGSAMGCSGTPNFSVLEFPGSVPPVIEPGYFIQHDGVIAYVHITESGWYTFQYEVNANGSTCSSGSSQIRVYLCLSENNLGSLYKKYCGIPDQLTLESPCNSNYTYGPWKLDVPNNMTNPPTIVQTGPCTADVTINNTNIDRYSFVQLITVNSCDVDGILEPCYAVSRIDYYAQPQIDDTLVTLFCGGDPNFFPWSYFPSYPGSNRTLRVIDSDDPVYPMGQTITGTVLMNLFIPGTYVFQMTIERAGCEDTAILTVIVDDLEQPEAGVVANFCLGETVTLTGSIPPNPFVQVLWRQLDGNLPLQFTPSTQETNPGISAFETGHYILEYSFSRTDDCYLADTLEFDVIPCDTGCLLVDIGIIRCFDNGTANPDDDYWNFDIFVHQGPGTFWRSGPPVFEAGAYDQWKTIWAGSIAGSPNPYTLTIFDNENPKCSTTITVQVPEPCSDTCNLEIEVEVSRCNNNGTTVLVSDDFYFVSVDVTGTGGQCWMAKKKNADGTEELLGTYTDDQPVNFGPFNIQDGDWTLWIFICDQMDCIVDVYIQAPDFCSGCHKVEVGNVKCYDNGTGNPNDDYWTFDLFVAGGPGTYWTTSGDVLESGPYGQVKTIHMGQISQYGTQITFTIYDNTTKSCQTEIILPVPKPCSDTCALQIGAIVGECIYTGFTPVYYVKLFVGGTNGGCWMVKQKFDNGTEVLLGTYYGDQTVGLGPFDPALGNWTLWVFPCENMDCIRDMFIDAPDCRRGEGRSAGSDRSGYQLFPSPVQTELIVQNMNEKQDDGAEETSFVVFDLLGKQVVRTTLPGAGSYRLNVEELNAGVYFLGVISDGKVEFAGKFVKQ